MTNKKWLVTFDDGREQIYYGEKEQVIMMCRFCSDLMFTIEEVEA